MLHRPLISVPFLAQRLIERQSAGLRMQACDVDIVPSSGTRWNPQYLQHLITSLHIQHYTELKRRRQQGYEKRLATWHRIPSLKRSAYRTGNSLITLSHVQYCTKSCRSPERRRQRGNQKGFAMWFTWYGITPMKRFTPKKR